jgi:hypothetical protein
MRRGAVIAAIATVALYASVSGQVSGRSYTVPRTADGQPDLQGFWTNDTVTPLERPAEFGNKEVLTSEEARPTRRSATISSSPSPRTTSITTMRSGRPRIIRRTFGFARRS